MNALNTLVHAAENRDYEDLLIRAPGLGQMRMAAARRFVPQGLGLTLPGGQTFDMAAARRQVLDGLNATVRSTPPGNGASALSRLDGASPELIRKCNFFSDQFLKDFARSGITVNGHSYEDPARQTSNTNFALLVAKHFSEPFKDSNGYGESIARLSNMLGGGVIVQRFGDLIRGQRSTPKRIAESFVTPTLDATPGDLSLVLPKRILDGIIEMLYALDKVAPGTANDDTLLYGVEVKFYNMEVAVDEHLQTRYPGLYVIGDGSGITHSLSHASASGVAVARRIAEHIL